MILIEHLIVIIKALIDVGISDIPDWVNKRYAMERQTDFKMMEVISYTNIYIYYFKQCNLIMLLYHLLFLWIYLKIKKIGHFSDEMVVKKLKNVSSIAAVNVMSKRNILN